MVEYIKNCLMVHLSLLMKSDEILQKIGVDIGNRTFNCHDDILFNRKTIR